MTKSKQKSLAHLRSKLSSKTPSVGSWIQINSCDVAELIAHSKYDWLVIDMEHGSISLSNLPSMIRSIELSGVIPLVRVPVINERYCKAVMDAGAYGLILPMVKSAEDIIQAINFSCWPPKGKRGVGFSRANMYGKYFEEYKSFSQKPFIVAQIENKSAFEDLEHILQIKDLDSIMIGPYDLAASLGKKVDLESKLFKSMINRILSLSKKFDIPCGIHQVKPNERQLKKYISSGYNFIAYSTDAYFLIETSINPLEREVK